MGRTPPHACQPGPVRLPVCLSLQPCPELSTNSRAFQRVLYLHSVTQATFCPSEPTPSAQLSRNHSPSPVRPPHPALAHSGFVKSCLILWIWSGWYHPPFPRCPPVAPEATVSNARPQAQPQAKVTLLCSGRHEAEPLWTFQSRPLTGTFWRAAGGRAVWAVTAVSGRLFLHKRWSRCLAIIRGCVESGHAQAGLLQSE